MDDLISRQSVINIFLYFNANQWLEMIKKLPSAQPTEASCWGCNCQKMERLKEQKTFSEMVHLHDAETHEKRTEERTEKHACDLIDRQAAIDALDAICERECEYSKPQRAVMCGACRLGPAFDVVDELPSAQQEHATCYLDSPCEYQNINIALPSAEPEIVRCKDCKHRDVEKGFCEGRGWPMQLVPDDGFCDKGERRTDE